MAASIAKKYAALIVGWKPVLDTMLVTNTGRNTSAGTARAAATHHMRGATGSTGRIGLAWERQCDEATRATVLSG